MEFWFSEEHTPNVKLSIRVDRQLYSGKSEFQRIAVFDSPEFGRFLSLDGYMMLTEKDDKSPGISADSGRTADKTSGKSRQPVRRTMPEAGDCQSIIERLGSIYF